MRNIRKGDKVQVIRGKDKGRVGIVQRVLNDKQGLSVIVEGLNVTKKHVKPNPQQERPGGIVQREAPMSISKVAVLDPTTNKPTRIGIKTLEDGRKVRVFKSSGEVVDV